MKKKSFVVWFSVFILGLIFIFSCYVWFLNKQKRVLVGTARPTFPYSDYSREELENIFPHDKENNAPVLQTPEQTHALFIQAVKNGDFKEAANCCFREGDRENTVSFLNELKKKGQINLMLSDIKEIHKDFATSWEASYTYTGTLNGEKVGSVMIFTKTTGGYWYIKSL